MKFFLIKSQVINENEEEIIEHNKTTEVVVQVTIFSDDDLEFESDIDDDLEDNITLIHLAIEKTRNCSQTHFQQLTGLSSQVPADVPKPIDFFLVLFSDAIRLVTELVCHSRKKKLYSNKQEIYSCVSLF